MEPLLFPTGHRVPCATGDLFGATESAPDAQCIAAMQVTAWLCHRVFHGGPLTIGPCTIADASAGIFGAGFGHPRRGELIAAAGLPALYRSPEDLHHAFECLPSGPAILAARVFFTRLAADRIGAILPMLERIVRNGPAWRDAKPFRSVEIVAAFEVAAIITEAVRQSRTAAGRGTIGDAARVLLKVEFDNSERLKLGRLARLSARGGESPAIDGGHSDPAVALCRARHARRIRVDIYPALFREAARLVSSNGDFRSDG